MPIHDWTRVPSGLFRDFHQSWSMRIKDALNAGRLPKGVAALVEQRAGPRESDVLAIEGRNRPRPGAGGDGGVAMMPRPVTQIVRRTTKEIYAGRANRIVVRHHLGRIIAVIEIPLPGQQGQPRRPPRLRREDDRIAPRGNSRPHRRSLPADAARPVRHPQGDRG
jgi:hypothetical protein